MKALIAALLLCFGGSALAAPPCTPAVHVVVQTAAPAAARAPADACAGVPAHDAPAMQQVLARAPLNDAPPGFSARASSPSSSAANPPRAEAVEGETAAPGHGRALLLAGLALMAGIALRRNGAGRE